MDNKLIESRKQQLLTELETLELRASNSDEVQKLYIEAFMLWRETGDNIWFQKYTNEHMKHPQLMR